jgi:hypothetical protein
MDKKNVPLQLASHTRLDQTLATNAKGKWTNESLKETMDVVKKHVNSLRKANKLWNITLT